MYCIKCGIELTDGKKACPLCGTVPYHPDIEGSAPAPTYPPFVKPKKKMNRGVTMIFVTLLYTLCAAQLALCDTVISSKITWSAYALGGMALFYVAFLLPLWFKKPNPVIFTPCAFAGAEVYLFFINLITGGDWFLSFAFPVAGIVGLIITAVVALVKYVKRGYFYIFGGAVIALGAAVILVELFATVTFGLEKFHMWSVYPASGALFLGAVLIVLGICEPLRRWFSKKFFI